MSWKISTNTGVFESKIGLEETIKLLAKVGFECYDISFFDLCKMDFNRQIAYPSDSPFNKENYKEYCAKIKALADSLGITCNQSHAPFPPFFPGAEKYILRSIECAALLGAKIIVIHPYHHYSPEENKEMYQIYLKKAKECNIKIATENMWSWDKNEDHASKASCSHHDDFLANCEAVNDPYFVACVDVGHASMKGLETSPEIMIKTLGKYCQAVHLHDTDCWHDNHQIPFSMNIDFLAIVKALKDINYEGDFTLEPDYYIANKKDEELEETARNLCAAATKIRDLFLSLK